jgi:hypothetical protein
MPSPDPNEFLGYIKYDGDLVADGIIDARVAAAALEGFDSAIRYFVVQERPELATTEFPIPVRIRNGSWTALIPSTIGEWITAGAGIALTAYLTTAATKLAEHDFKDIGVRDLFTKALKGVQWFIKIGKHLGTLTERRLTNLRWRENNTEVGVPNEHGVYLFVPREFFEAFLKAPSGLLSRVVKIVETERILLVGRNEAGQIDEVSVTSREKHIFYTSEEEPTQTLFPELAHGQPVTLDGIVTRGNETANSIGFRYSEHILTCYPRIGSVVRFKPHLFLRCIIVGQVSRADGHGGTSDPRPKIIFDDLSTIEPEGGSQELF